MKCDPPRQTTERIPGSVIAFTGTYLGAALIASVVTGNGEFLFYIAVMAVMIFAVWCLHRSVKLTHGLLWGLSLWGALHMAGGLVPVPESWPINGQIRVLYSWWLIPGKLKYDHLVHAYGFGLTTLVCWHGMKATLRAVLESDSPARDIDPFPTLGRLILCAGCGMGFGALNEVIEFLITLLLPQTNVGGYINTGWDLVSNLVGCIIAAMLIRLQANRLARRS